MDKILSIRPSKDVITNYNQISKLTRKNPVAITINGKEDTVLISYEDYISLQNHISVLEDQLAIYEHLAQAEDDIKYGRVKDSDEVFDELIKELEELK